jgi:hypothetical protein
VVRHSYTSLVSTFPMLSGSLSPALFPQFHRVRYGRLDKPVKFIIAATLLELLEVVKQKPFLMAHRPPYGYCEANGEYFNHTHECDTSLKFV